MQHMALPKGYHIVEGVVGSAREGPFEPQFTHQVFEDEQVPAQVHAIRARISLQTAASAVEVEADDDNKGSLCVARQRAPRGAPDPMPRSGAKIRDQLRPALVEEAESAAAVKAAPAVDPYGELAAHYEAAGTRFETWLGCPAQAATDGQPAPREHHTRLQGLAQLFVDAASAIDLEDPRWRVFTLWAREGERAAVAGFATAFAFQNPIKGPAMRVCQVLVLPPYQRQGETAPRRPSPHDTASLTPSCRRARRPALPRDAGAGTEGGLLCGDCGGPGGRVYPRPWRAGACCSTHELTRVASVAAPRRNRPVGHLPRPWRSHRRQV